MNSLDKLNALNNDKELNENKLIEFYIDLTPFMLMYKERNDIQGDIQIKDILDHWNEELANEFSDFKYIDIEQIGSDEDNGKFIIALLSGIDFYQEKNILEWIDTDMEWDSVKLFTPFSEWESMGSDWKTFAEDYHGYSELDEDEFLELLDAAESEGREKLYPTLFKEAEKLIETCEQYSRLGDYAVTLYSKDFARNLFKKAEELAEDGGDYQNLANSVADNLGDKDWALKLYKKVEELAEDSVDYQSLAESVANDLSDKDWALRLYKKAEELAEVFDDYHSLAESVVDDESLGDKDWARDLYKKAEKLIEDMHDHLILAEKILDDESLGDKDWARDLYKKALELVEDKDDYETLADSIEYEDNLGDEEWAEEIRKKGK